MSSKIDMKQSAIDAEIVSVLWELYLRAFCARRAKLASAIGGAIEQCSLVMPLESLSSAPAEIFKTYFAFKRLRRLSVSSRKLFLKEATRLERKTRTR